jgi:hypoxanthine phosphoribosyltransferase/DNA-binding XRE family transcriptional regulator
MTEATTQPDGKKIKDLRLALGLTQQELANLASCGKRTIENAEAGKKIKEENMLNIAHVLKVDAKEISKSDWRQGVPIERLQRGSRVSWEKVHELARSVACQMTDAHFIPDVIMTGAGPPVIVAQLIDIEIGEELRPLHVLLQKMAGTTDPFPIPGTELVTSKWRWLMPDCGLSDASRVLIVHDVIHTGDTTTTVKSALIQRGLARDRIRVASLLAVEGLELAHKAPDFLGGWIKSIEVTMPWGHASKRARIAALTKQKGGPKLRDR